MEARAESKFIIVSPKKVWRVTRELRGLTYKNAMEFLREITPKPARIMEKILKSAFFNAIQKDSNLTEDDVVIKTVFVTKGPNYKRMRPRAQGRADIIKKRTSHINVVLGKREEI
ncbi:MAG: 50S ribosomal protein L22 [Spirochaetes bacterium GWB1_36_13]|nr:MAG: 50S ribosomal protein L22 [Spirochaetes bacterium GWB1_36_13]